MTDPSMRAVGGGHTVIGQTAHEVLNVITPEWPGRALYHREGFGRMWQGPGKSALIIALQTALLDLAGETGPAQVRLCPSIRIDRELDGKRRLCTPDEMQQRVASLKEAGFTAVRLELAGALDDEMKARGECAPYRYPQEVLGQIDKVVLGAKQAAGSDMDVTVAAEMNLSTDGLTYLALRCERNEVNLLENPMAVRHLIAQGHARKEFSQPLGFGQDYHVLEDFAQGIKHQIGTVLTPDAGLIGGVTMIARTADLAKDANLKVAPVVQGGPLSLLAVARSLSGREEVLWVTGAYQDEWLKKDGVLKVPLRMTQGSLDSEACEIDETKFQIKRITAKDLLFRPRRSVTGHCPGLEGVQGEEGVKEPHSPRTARNLLFQPQGPVTALRAGLEGVQQLGISSDVLGPSLRLDFCCWCFFYPYLKQRRGANWVESKGGWIRTENPAWLEKRLPEKVRDWPSGKPLVFPHPPGSWHTRGNHLPFTLVPQVAQ